MDMTNSAAFKDAMSRFPSGVTIVSTTDSQNRHWGFTASSFTSLSMEPPLVLVCLSNRADSYEAFMTAGRFAINVLSQDQRDIALRFARKSRDKFNGSDEFSFDTDGCPYLQTAITSLLCKARKPHVEGDHTILVGEVQKIHLGGAEPLVYFNRDFWNLEPAAVLG